MTDTKISPWAQEPTSPAVEEVPSVKRKSNRPSPWSQDVPSSEVQGGGDAQKLTPKRKIPSLLTSAVLGGIHDLNIASVKDDAPDLYFFYESLKRVRLNFIEEVEQAEGEEAEMAQAAFVVLEQMLQDPDGMVVLMQQSGMSEEQAQIAVKQSIALMQECKESDISDISEAWNYVDRSDEIIDQAKQSESHMVRSIAEKVDNAVNKVIEHGIMAAYR